MRLYFWSSKYPKLERRNGLKSRLYYFYFYCCYYFYTANWIFKIHYDIINIERIKGDVKMEWRIVEEFPNYEVSDEG